MCKICGMISIQICMVPIDIKMEIRIQIRIGIKTIPIPNSADKTGKDKTKIEKQIKWEVLGTGSANIEITVVRPSENLNLKARRYPYRVNT